MPAWDPDRYLQFSSDRARPFLDLVARVPGEPSTIVDLGCGPGHLSQVLRTRWPEAQIHGVDSSSEMIARAVADNEDERVTYELADVSSWDGRSADLFISNALFQWVPEQLAVIRRLAGLVRPGGTFAVQVPHNHISASHLALRELAADQRYARYTGGVVADQGQEPESYLALFSALGWSVDLWETTYFHVLPGDDPVFDWVSGTGARPYLQALPDDLRAEFTESYRLALREAFPQRRMGTVFEFRRTFVVARRDG